MEKKQITDRFAQAKIIFFAGIGGISMSSLALYARAKGKEVHGSDTAVTPLTEKLKKNGITVFKGHDAKHVSGADLFVYSHAIAPDNAELLAAKSAGIPVLTRAEFLGAVMSPSRTRIGISGCHGKSTVTGMTAKVLLDAGKDPTVFCGADLPFLDGACRFGSGEFLFEACEYRDSFLSFSPNVAVILNVGYDHADYFESLEKVKASFARYAKISSEDGGSVIANADDENTMDALGNEFPILYGIENECDYKAVRIRSKNGFYSFDIEKFEEPFLSLSLKVPGFHNIYNALAAVCIADLLGIPAGTIRKSLDGFVGISRRMEKKGKTGGASVYSDYAHHPDEIKAVIETAKEMTDGRVLAVFEPHTFSRLKKLYPDFVNALKLADVRIITDIYPARETDTLGLSSEKLAKDAGGLYARDFADAREKIKENAKENDIVLVLGAGTIDRLCTLLTEEE